MRIVKERIGLMLPNAKIFLDVDDLEEGKGAEYVDASAVSLIFCSGGYFVSANCMRELLRAVTTRKPIVTLLEPEAKHGGLTAKEVKHQLDEAYMPCENEGTKHDSKFAMWGLSDEVESWGYAMPTADALYAALFETPNLIEWNRIGAFQDVSMRLIAKALLPPNSAAVFVQGELSQQETKLPAPRGNCAYHLFCSASNVGARELARELEKAQDLKVLITADVAMLPRCERMLVYLTDQTWTSGVVSKTFAEDVERAMSLKIGLQLAHEMLGLGQVLSPTANGSRSISARHTPRATQ